MFKYLMIIILACKAASFGLNIKHMLCLENAHFSMTNEENASDSFEYSHSHRHDDHGEHAENTAEHNHNHTHTHTHSQCSSCSKNLYLLSSDFGPSSRSKRSESNFPIHQQLLPQGYTKGLLRPPSFFLI